MKNETPLTARTATLKVIADQILPNFIHPVPGPATLRVMFDNAAIPRFKANPTAKRGGGYVYYSVSHVEKLFRSRTMPVARG